MGVGYSVKIGSFGLWNGDSLSDAEEHFDGQHAKPPTSEPLDPRSMAAVLMLLVGQPKFEP